jgi:hypothetical protein
MDHGERAALVIRRAAIEEQIVALEHERAAIDDRICPGPPGRGARLEVPCWTCQRPQAADVRHQLSSSSAMPALSPSGFPLMCCRVTHVQNVW